MTFGERLKYLREEKELHQYELAEYLNISSRMISYYEADKHFPSDAQMVIDLAKFFNVSLDYLFGISNVKNNDTINKFNSDFADLSDDNKKSAFDYIQYLKFRQGK